MRPSALLSLRSLVSKIHPRLPLDQRESQQLLSLLTSSFRHHLNSEYPLFRTDEIQDQFTDKPGRNGARGRARQGAAARSGSEKLMSSAAAQHHFGSILTSPLFTKRRRSSSPRRPGDGARKCSLEDVRRIVNDPMGMFEENVALGAATVDMATFCLTTHMKEILGSSILPVREGMRESGAGTKVLKWMWSSGLSASNDFLADERFVSALVPFLVVEGHSDVAWFWMKRSVAANKNPNVVSTPAYLQHSATREKRGLLLKLVEAELNYGGGIDTAIGVLQRAADGAEAILALDVPGHGSPKMVTGAARAFLAPAGKLLYSHCMRLLSTSNLSPAALDTFLTVIPKFSPIPELYQAWLRMYHPSDPSAHPAVRLLRSASRASSVLHGGGGLGKQRRVWIRFGLDTARVLLKEEQWEDGAWVLGALQTSFPEELGLRDCTGGPHTAAVDEQANLRLLEWLDVSVRWNQL
ncbi:MAG: hypothetical protein M1839_006196 [Geoglossum umbratile]|nr:MAG: hypothetical protein M1839_006196 [Geoglossum umbratile]